MQRIYLTSKNCSCIVMTFIISCGMHVQNGAVTQRTSWYYM